jgi:hypothetical protein
MSCPTPSFQELGFRELLHRAQSDDSLLDEAFEQSLVGLRMILDQGCDSCVRLAVNTLHQNLAWPARRDICLLMIRERLHKKAGH